MTYTLLPRHPDAPQAEYIYFVYSAGRIKIGYSRGTEGRVKNLATSGPFPPEILLVMHGTMGDEADFHVRFHADRLHGEWFALSKELRRFLNARLCDDGLATLDRAEAEFRAYCETILGRQAPPRNRKRRPLCPHGGPVGSICLPCERDRDLKILDQINAGTYASPPATGNLVGDHQ